jgi:hypothetical protein
MNLSIIIESAFGAGQTKTLTGIALRVVRHWLYNPACGHGEPAANPFSAIHPETNDVPIADKHDQNI